MNNQIYKKCQKDFEFYCEYSLSIESPIYGEVPFKIGEVPFKLFDYQKYVSRLLDNKKKMVVVTPRQMGFTSLVAARCFWEIQSKPNINVLVVVPGHHMVKYFMSIIDRWISYGKYFKQSPNGHWSTKVGEIKCIANNSTLTCHSSISTFHNIRGKSIDILVLLDFAWCDTAQEIIKTLFPALTPSSKVLMVSTPANTSKVESAKVFKEFYFDAQKGKNDFYPYRVPWWSKPGHSINKFADIVSNFSINDYDYEILAKFD